MFAQASVFVNTTMPGREGFPNTYIQAWMHETPVVTLDCDPDEIIKTHGLGFHSSSFEKMVDDVSKLCTDKELRLSMGKRAHAYALEHHDIRKLADQVDKLFSRIIEVV